MPKKTKIKFEIRIKDGLNAFGAYLRPSLKDGKALIFIDGKLIFSEGELLADGEPYDPPNSEKKAILIETLMHEFGHALEDFFEEEFGEEFIEKCVERYRNLNHNG